MNHPHRKSSKWLIIKEVSRSTLRFSVKSNKKTGAQNSPGRPRKSDSLASVARRLTKELGFNVTVKSVRGWKGKGYPLDNPEKLLECVGAQQRAGDLAPKNLTDAKLAKLNVDIEAAKFRLAVARGEYTHNDAVRDQGQRIGAATRAELMRFKADAPTWEGLNAAEIERRVTSLIDTICRNLGSSLSKVYAGAVGRK